MGQTTARMVRAIFLAGIGVISAIAGSVVFYVVLTDGAHSQYGSPLAAADVAYAWIAGGIAFVLPFYLLRLVANLWQSAVSVMWVCYLIDLETGACHNPWVHRIFGSALG
ncbi:hypothetical protein CAUPRSCDRAFT_13184 [Caulochytrium protostelioides]|nr:hypothetical protein CAUPRSCDRAFT_13184 [Caulochytrium protostelioides]